MMSRQNPESKPSLGAMPPACLPLAQPPPRKRMQMTCYVCALFASADNAGVHAQRTATRCDASRLPSAQPLPPIYPLQMTRYVRPCSPCRLAGAHLPRRDRRASRHESAGRFSGSDETAAVDVESPRRNANKKLQRSTSDLAHDSQLKRMCRVLAPLHGANPGKVPCRALRTVPRNAQRPRPQIFTACRH